MQTKKNIALTLKQEKGLSGKSMEEFAFGLNLAKSTMQNCINMANDESAANPTIETLDQIAQGLNMTVAQLVSDPNSLHQYPLECANCLKMPVHSLHPELRKPAELMLELFCNLSRQLYRIDEK